MEDILEQHVNSAIAEHLFPGCQIGVLVNDHISVFCYGRYTYEMDARMVTQNTQYDIASLTKTLPTAVLALQLIDQNKLSLNDAVQMYVPQFDGMYANKVVIKDLLTQTVSYSFRLSSEIDKNPTQLADFILHTDLPEIPGARFSYTNASSILLGWVVEAIHAKSLSEVASTQLFAPLGLSATTFSPQKQNCPPTENTKERGKVQGTVHDESAAILEELGSVGSAGLFSTATDLLSFLDCIMNMKKEKILSKKMITTMSENHVIALGSEHGLGWELHQPWFMGKLSSAQTIGKTGFTGCSMMYDRKRDRAVVILSNALYPKRPLNRDKLNTFRSTIADIVFSQ
jgi:CubicO group peptidase (beta-lactamase class C family)